MTVLAAALFAAACGDEGATAVDTRPGVRFFNATMGMSGKVGFTTDGQFAGGSALALGESTQTCSRLTAGSTSFGFGAANAGGTDLSGGALATLGSQSVATGGNYTVVAAGSAASPTLLLFDNTFPGTLASNQAAVRFVNLAPDPAYNYRIYQGEVGLTDALAINPPFGSPTAFMTMTRGSTSFGVLRLPGHNIIIPASPHTLQAGTDNTLALVETSGGLQLINIRGC